MLASMLCAVNESLVISEVDYAIFDENGHFNRTMNP